MARRGRFPRGAGAFRRVREVSSHGERAAVGELRDGIGCARRGCCRARARRPGAVGIGCRRNRSAARASGAGGPRLGRRVERVRPSARQSARKFGVAVGPRAGAAGQRRRGRRAHGLENRGERAHNARDQGERAFVAGDGHRARRNRLAQVGRRARRSRRKVVARRKIYARAIVRTRGPRRRGARFVDANWSSRRRRVWPIRRARI